MEGGGLCPRVGGCMSLQRLRVGCWEEPWKEMEGPVREVVEDRRVGAFWNLQLLGHQPSAGAERAVSTHVVIAKFLPS